MYLIDRNGLSPRPIRERNVFDRFCRRVFARSRVRSLRFDRSSNGTVEQSDLDLVLLHWGAGATAVPDSWTNDLPTGTIDQDEFDGVLLNWGNTSTAAITLNWHFPPG